MKEGTCCTGLCTQTGYRFPQGSVFGQALSSNNRIVRDVESADAISAAAWPFADTPNAQTARLANWRCLSRGGMETSIFFRVDFEFSFCVIAASRSRRPPAQATSFYGVFGCACFRSASARHANTVPASAATSRWNASRANSGGESSGRAKDKSHTCIVPS